MRRSKPEESEPCIGTTVMGERGQIVIPKEVREYLGLKTGDKFIVLAPHDHALAIIPLNKAKGIMDLLKKRMSFIEKSI